MIVYLVPASTDEPNGNSVSPISYPCSAIGCIQFFLMFSRKWKKLLPRSILVAKWKQRCTVAKAGKLRVLKEFPFSRKSMLLEKNSSISVDRDELSTVQDAGCAWMTLVGESLHLSGLSCGSKWPSKLFVGRERKWWFPPLQDSLA